MREPGVDLPLQAAVGVKAAVGLGDRQPAGIDPVVAGPALEVIGPVPIADAQVARDRAGHDAQAIDPGAAQQPLQFLGPGPAGLVGLPSPDGRLLLPQREDRPAQLVVLLRLSQERRCVDGTVVGG
jgi:hypothetical protein